MFTNIPLNRFTGFYQGSGVSWSSRSRCPSHVNLRFCIVFLHLVTFGYSYICTFVMILGHLMFRTFRRSLLCMLSIRLLGLLSTTHNSLLYKKMMLTYPSKNLTLVFMPSLCDWKSSFNVFIVSTASPVLRLKSFLCLALILEICMFSMFHHLLECCNLLFCFDSLAGFHLVAFVG